MGDASYVLTYWKSWTVFWAIEVVLPLLATTLLCIWIRKTWYLRFRAPLLGGTRLAVLYVLSRLVFACVLYFGVGFEGLGDMGSWLRWARATADGQVPGRDFPYNYGPLFAYLHAGGFLLVPWNHPFGVLIPMIIADALAVLACRKIGEETSPGLGGDWVAGWLVLTPLMWHQLVVRAAEESIFLGSLAGAIWLLHQRRVTAGMILLTLGFCATKVTFAPYALAACVPALCSGTRFADFAVPALATGGIVYGIWMALGASLFDFLEYPGEKMWWLNLSSLTRLLPVGAQRTAGLVGYGAVALLLPIWLGLRKTKHGYLRHAVFCVTIVHAATMLVQPYATANYLSQAIGIVLVALLPVADSRGARSLLVLMPLLGLAVAVSRNTPYDYATTTARLYRYCAVPLFVLVHAILLWVAWRAFRQEPAPDSSVTSEDAVNAG